MKRRERVNDKKKREGRARAKRRPVKGLTLMASIEEPEPSHARIPNLKLYRPVKQAVTMRLDADVIAWFKKGGRPYQRRINRALREVMEREMREEGEGGEEENAAQFGSRAGPVNREIPSASLRAGSSLRLKNGYAQDDGIM